MILPSYINLILYAVEPAYSYLRTKKVNVNLLNSKFKVYKLLNSECCLFITGTSENVDSIAFQFVEHARKKFYNLPTPSGKLEICLTTPSRRIIPIAHIVLI